MITCCNSQPRSQARCFRVSPTGKAIGRRIFLCMASPLLVAALCMGRRQLHLFLFCIAGMGVCLLSAYINTFLASVCQADALAATVEIAPVVEEVMKLLPLVFYLLVFEPEGEKIKPAAITIALAFALPVLLIAVGKPSVSRSARRE